MSSLKLVDDASFDAEVLQSEIPVLVDFSAEWCGPCSRQLPVLEKLSSDFKDQIKFVKLDVDDAVGVTSKFNVKSLPTLILFKDGKNIGSKVGLINPNILKTFIADSLKND